MNVIRTLTNVRKASSIDKLVFHQPNKVVIVVRCVGQGAHCEYTQEKAVLCKFC